MEPSNYREFFATLANLSRLAIVQFLRRRGATVTQIADTLGFEQSRVSHSLARLQRAGIVVCRWEDKRKVFHLVDDVAPVLVDIENYLARRAGMKEAAKNGADRAWGATAWAGATSES